MAEIPSGTVTFLFTDIEGSTAHWERQPEAMAASLARHDQLLRAAIGEHRGYVVKTVGDAFYAAFARAPDAVQAALDAQRRLHRETWDELGTLRVRMALHTGAAEERDGDYFGPPLNRVARLLSAGHGAQILLSQVTYDLIRDTPPAGVVLVDLGDHRLKDLIRPERVFQLTPHDLPAEFPPLRSLDRHRHNLTVQPTPFIGRQHEIAVICALLNREDVRLVTLTGPGGTGKTRLGVQVAAELIEAYPDGAFFVDLAPISDPALVVSTIAQTLGVADTDGRPMADVLVDRLHEQRLLLVLDNLEQVLGAATIVDRLLRACPNLSVLITSRAPLQLRGEHEFPVAPLALPDLERSFTPESLSRYESVALFVERATAVRPDFTVTNVNAPAVAEICTRLDGLPLAIELAAARLRLLSAEAMLRRLGHGLTLLTGGRRDLPSRQQTLRSAIAWSYDLLPEAEQQLFRRLSMFVGGFTLEAAEAVCSADEDLGIDTLDGVESLVANSLVRPGEETEDEPRFRMLETIREYAAEQFEPSTDGETWRRRHTEHYLGLAEQAAPELLGPRQGRWLARLEREHDNLRAALRWTVDRDESALGLRLAAALGHFWQVHGHLTEGQGWLELALSRWPEAPALARVEAVSAAGNLAYIRGEYERAATLHEESLDLRRTLDDRRGVALSPHNLGRVAHYQGDFERAAALYDESLSNRRALGDERGIALSLNSIGVLARNRGDHQRARAMYEESLTIFQSLGDTWGTGLVLNNLSRVARDLEEWESMASLCAESLTLFQDLGDRHGVAWVLSNLIVVAERRSAWEWAARLHGAADVLRESVGSAALSLSPSEQITYEAAVAATRARPGDDAITSAMIDGRTLLPEQIADAARVIAGVD